MKTFNHDLDNFGITNIDRAQGFIDCLGEVLKYIEEITELKPEKRYIDAVRLIDVIKNTSDEIRVLLNKAEKELSETLQAIK